MSLHAKCIGVGASSPPSRDRVSWRGLLLIRAAGGLAVLTVGIVASPAYADGGHIALRATSGAYSITLFTAPEPLVSGLVDLSLLVQDQTTGEVIDDATASGTLTGPTPQPLSFLLTHAADGNKLLFAAQPALPGPGSYTLILRVERPQTAPASFTTVLNVGENHRRRTILLFALVLPFAVILLFLVNQQAKYRRTQQPSALH